MHSTSVMGAHIGPVCLILYLRLTLHGACFGADSAPILFVRNTRRVNAAFDTNASHYEHSSRFHRRRLMSARNFLFMQILTWNSFVEPM